MFYKSDAFLKYYDEACTQEVIWYGDHYTVTSDENGKVSFYGLAAGTYYLKELEAPEGYVLSNEVFKITLGEEEVDISGSVDMDADALKGAVFGVYYDEDCTHPVTQNAANYTVTSDGNGKITFNGLAGGTYYLKEIEAPEGHELIENVITVTLGDHKDNYSYYLTVSNTPTGTTGGRSGRGGSRSGGGGGSGSSSSGGSGTGGPGDSGGGSGDGDVWDLLPMSQTGQGKAMLIGASVLLISAMALIVLLWFKRKESKS